MPVILLLLILYLVGREAESRASYLACGLPTSYIGGAANNYGTTAHPATYTTGSSSTCLLTISPSATTYTPGQKFTISVQTNTNAGFKISANAGSWSGPSSGGVVNGRCVDYDLGRQPSGSQTYTAPASGTVTIKAICETRSGPAYVSNAITLTAVVPTSAPISTRSPTSLAPTSKSPTTASPFTASPFTASPFTTTPTFVGQTWVPTVSPTKSTNKPSKTPTSRPTLRPTTRNPTYKPSVAPTTSPPTVAGQSSDPAYIFEWQIDPVTMLYYAVNGTHAKFKLVRDDIGYIGLGVGDSMVGSLALIGMTGSNPPGIYSIVGNSGNTLANIVTPLAVTATTLQSYGINGLTFAIVNVNGMTPTTTMTFTVLLAGQKPEFTLVQADGSNVNLLFVAGPPSSNGVLCSASMCYAHAQESGLVLSNTNFAYAPGEAPFVPPPVKLSLSLTIHIVTMLLGWGFLIPVGIALPLWNNIKYSSGMKAPMCGLKGLALARFHWVSQSLGVVLTFIGTITGYLESGNVHLQDVHCQLGLLLFLISIIQPAYAFLRPTAKTRTGMKRIARQLFDYLHVPVGYVSVFLAIAENLIGIQEIVDVTAAGSDTVVCLGGKGPVGFGGPMGLATVFLSLVMLIALVAGLVRAGLALLKRRQEARAHAHVGDDSTSAVISTLELEKHATQQDCWMAYKGRVYNVTSFLASHPGGKKLLLPYMGRDMTQAYDEAGHSAQATAMLDRYFVGRLEGQPMRRRTLSHQLKAEASRQWGLWRRFNKKTVHNDDGSGPETAVGFFSSSSAAAAPSSRSNSAPRRVRMQLAKKLALSKNAYVLTFIYCEDNEDTRPLNIPTGKHISLFAPNVPGKSRGLWNQEKDKDDVTASEIQRKYTPIGSDSKGIELVVKLYRPCPPKYPDGGKMSRFLDGLSETSEIEVAGPFGTHEYLGQGRFKSGAHELVFNEVAMIAGGSGIAPMMQLLRAMFVRKNSKEKTRVSLLFANTTVDDVILKSELDALERNFPDRFKVWYTVTAPSQSWKYSTGRITSAMVKQHLPRASPTTIAVISGLRPMMDTANELLQRELGFPENSIIEY